jgi:hypothetical protein
MMGSKLGGQSVLKIADSDGLVHKQDEILDDLQRRV